MFFTQFFTNELASVSNKLKQKYFNALNALFKNIVKFNNITYNKCNNIILWILISVT